MFCVPVYSLFLRMFHVHLRRMYTMLLLNRMFSLYILSLSGLKFHLRCEGETRVIGAIAGGARVLSSATTPAQFPLETDVAAAWSPETCAPSPLLLLDPLVGLAAMARGWNLRHCCFPSSSYSMCSNTPASRCIDVWISLTSWYV